VAREEEQMTDITSGRPTLGLWERRHQRFGLAGEGQADVIESYLASHPGRILYVGCGLGDYKFENLSKYGTDVVVIDRNDNMLRNAKEEAGDQPNIEFRVGDARNLEEFEKESFDHILALGLFAYIHMHEVETVFSQFWRVGRHGGYLMLTNATRHPKDAYIDAGLQCGFELLRDKEGYCPAASSKRRYLLVFAKANAKGLPTRVAQQT
jgi:ubiquinone/menaquinone biosynthesis C-methylase UbiE